VQADRPGDETIRPRPGLSLQLFGHLENMGIDPITSHSTADKAKASVNLHFAAIESRLGTMLARYIDNEDNRNRTEETSVI